MSLTKKSIQRGPIVAKASPLHGVGVFATAAIAKRDVVEATHVVPINQHHPNVSHYLNDHLFLGKDEQASMSLGLGAYYNHANKPNLNYKYDTKKHQLILTAKRPIRKGEELCIHYGEQWFRDRPHIRWHLPWHTRLMHKAIREYHLLDGLLLTLCGGFYIKSLLFIS